MPIGVRSAHFFEGPRERGILRHRQYRPCRCSHEATAWYHRQGLVPTLSGRWGVLVLGIRRGIGGPVMCAACRRRSPLPGIRRASASGRRRRAVFGHGLLLLFNKGPVLKHHASRSRWAIVRWWQMSASCVPTLNTICNTHMCCRHVNDHLHKVQRRNTPCTVRTQTVASTLSPFGSSLPNGDPFPPVCRGGRLVLAAARRAQADRGDPMPYCVTLRRGPWRRSRAGNVRADVPCHIRLADTVDRPNEYILESYVLESIFRWQKKIVDAPMCRN